MTSRTVDVAIVGAGSVGIAVAYYLHLLRPGLRLALIDSGQPMAATSAASGENYRNWWPHPVMRRFVDHSIDLMESLADQSDNRIHMTRRGYVLATRRDDVEAIVGELTAGYGDDADLRLHDDAALRRYRASDEADWRAAPDGIDVLHGSHAVASAFPSLGADIGTVVHIRRGGDISGQQMGQLMLERLRIADLRVTRARVENITSGAAFSLALDDGTTVHAAKLVNAAGPWVAHIAELLGEALPVRNVLQQKLAFEDVRGAVPRTLPFCIDLDAQTLGWTDEERALLAAEPHLAGWLDTLPGAVHCRPEGGANGRWVKVGWAINESSSEASDEPALDDVFPDMVIRAAGNLQPSLAAYRDDLPRSRRHYGGFYTMTEENWPLIGPMATPGAFIAGALSGFGTMAACATGELCATWVLEQTLPPYADALSLARQNDHALLTELRGEIDRGLL